MIANVLTALGVAVTLLGVLDLLLSEQQKKTISDQTIRLWARLDDWKRFPVLSLLKQKKIQYLLTLSVMALVTVSNLSFTYWLVAPDLLFSKNMVTPLGIQIGIWIIAAIIGFKIVAWTLQGAGQFRILLRLAAAPVIVTALTSAGAAILILIMSLYDPNSVGFVTLMSLIFAINLTAILVVYWLFAAVPLLLISLARALLFSSELLVRRIAENPKGPILAVSALFTIIVQLFR